MRIRILRTRMRSGRQISYVFMIFTIFMAVVVTIAIRHFFDHCNPSFLPKPIVVPKGFRSEWPLELFFSLSSSSYLYGFSVSTGEFNSIIFCSLNQAHLDVCVCVCVCVCALACVYAVTGQNGSGQNGTDKMVWTKWCTAKMVLDKMVWTKWYVQNDTVLYFVNILILLNSIYI